MEIVNVLLVLALVGALLWVLVTFVPMPDVWKNILVAVAAILVGLWLFRAFSHLLGEVRLP